MPAAAHCPAVAAGQVAIRGLTIGTSAVNTDPDATAVATTLTAYYPIDKVTYLGAGRTAC